MVEKNKWSVFNFQDGFGYFTIVASMSLMAFSSYYMATNSFIMASSLMGACSLLLTIVATIISVTQLSFHYETIKHKNKALLKESLYYDLMIEEKIRADIGMNSKETILKRIESLSKEIEIMNQYLIKISNENETS